MLVDQVSVHLMSTRDLLPASPYSLSACLTETSMPTARLGFQGHTWHTGVTLTHFSIRVTADLPDMYSRNDEALCASRCWER